MQSAVLLVLALSFGAEPRSDVGVHPRVAKEWPGTEARQTEILAELATLDRASLNDDDWAKDWAGVYYAGDGLILNIAISIAPKSGVAYLSRGCTGIHAANYGEVAEPVPGGIKLKLAADLGEGPGEFMSSTLYFIRWGDQQFLVPERHLLRLVAQYNAGGTDRDRMQGIPRRAADNGRRNTAPQPTPPGRPKLPAEFAAMIIEKPTRLKITSVKTEGQAVTFDKGETSYVQGQIELEGGRDLRLFVGTAIDCRGQGRKGSIRLDKVDDAKSSGRFFVYVDDPAGQPLEVGAEVLLPGADPDIAAQK